jgi:hypothetical protein
LPQCSGLSHQAVADSNCDSAMTVPTHSRLCSGKTCADIRGRAVLRHCHLLHLEGLSIPTSMWEG